MITTARTSVNIVEIGDVHFDTELICAAINRLLDSRASEDGPVEVLDVEVRGQVASDPGKLFVISKVLYRTSNCVASIPFEVDAGALRGLEVGIAAD